MVTKNRLTTSRGKDSSSPRAVRDAAARVKGRRRHVDGRRVSTSSSISTGKRQKKKVRDGFAQPGNKPNQHFLC